MGWRHPKDQKREENVVISFSISVVVVAVVVVVVQALK